MKEKISHTDRIGYKTICRDASENDEVFKTFKQHEDYTPVLEHSNYYKEGMMYRNFILDRDNLYKSKFEKFKENDIYGTPSMYNYGKEFGKISPSTLRYVKILSDLLKRFGSLDNFNIVEIGSGYGGQAKIIMDYFKVKEYNFIDLPEAISLTKKYLGKFDYDNLNFLDFNNLPDKKYDLVISNYAISECIRKVQELYIDKVINNSKHGYMIMNRILPGNMTIYEWLNTLSNVTIHPDEPLSSIADIIKFEYGTYLLTF